MAPRLCLLVLSLLVPALPGQKPSSRPAAPAGLTAEILTERMLQYAGGRVAFRKLDHIAFRAARKRVARERVVEREESWLLAPPAHRARWESPDVGRPVTGRGIRYDVMVLDTASEERKNLVTQPERPRGSISLFSKWQEIRRYLFLPFVAVEKGVVAKLMPVQEGDDATVRRLRVVWPKTRNYEWMDEWELVVSVDTGRIDRFTAISGSRGQHRSEFEVRKWRNVGPLLLPVDFALESGRGDSVSLLDLRTGLDLPKDIWSSRVREIERLNSKRK